MLFFQYGQKEKEYLKQRDQKLGALIDRMGHLSIEVMPDLFSGLVFSVLSQQISSRAADTVWKRFQVTVCPLTPEEVLRIDPEILQKCGTTFRKVGTIRGIAEASLSGNLDFQEFVSMSDDQVIRRLSDLPGVGTWTAEMLLIFSLHRPDVVSYDDLAIRRAMMKLYNRKSLSREQFHWYRKRYSPYGSVASLYLWELSLE